MSVLARSVQSRAESRPTLDLQWGWGREVGWGAGVGEGSAQAALDRIRLQNPRLPPGGASRPLNLRLGLTSAPRLPGLPLWTRRQSRSAPRCFARAQACLGLGSGSGGAPRPRLPGTRRHNMARAQALVLALTFQLCAPETETPAGKCASVGPSLPCGIPGPVAQLGRKCEFGMTGHYELAPRVCLSVGCAILGS